MCGISGFVDFMHGVQPSILWEMTEIIRHRGPDDEGYALFSERDCIFAYGNDTVESAREGSIPVKNAPVGKYALGLGHRRLSILDLSARGHQPMSLGERYTVVYNGEIYNYIELADELNALGYGFQGTGDTEVLLAAYDAWGKDCVNRFNGMWAFCIYDKEKRELFFSRDRFGVKPLYYWTQENRLVFGSELKQLMQVPFIPHTVNNRTAALHLFLSVQNTTDDTFFEGIRQLPAGCNMIIQLDFQRGSVTVPRIERYYHLRSRVLLQAGRPDAAERLGEQLERAVRLRLRADVKVGSCLSGGMDSSSIVALACLALREQGRDPVDFETVTSHFPDHPEIDESNFAKMVAQAAGCSPSLVTPRMQPDGKELEDLIWHQDIPIPGLSLLVQWNVFKTAAERGIKVLLDGQGSDEAIGGYASQHYAFLANWFEMNGLAGSMSRFREAAENGGLPRANLIPAVRKRFRTEFTFPDDPAIFSQLLLNFNDKQAVNDLLKRRDNQEILFDAMLRTSLPQILHWEDRDSMAFSLETRVPFTDYEYVETVLSIPLAEKIQNGFTKYPLRKFMQGKMPEDVIWRKNKLGFPAPDEAWLYSLHRDYVLDLFDHARSAPYYNIPRLRQQYLEQSAPHFPLVRFVLFEIWMRTFQMNIQS